MPPLPHLGPFLDRGHCLSEVLLGWRIHREPTQRDYGQEPSMRHYKRPLTIMRTNLDYQLNTHHSFNLNYHLSRTGNDRLMTFDTSFEPSKDVVTKHILGLSYNQSLLDGKMETYSS